MTFQPTRAQSDAIDSTAGDLFISAGAGSGKTAVLARRFARGVERGVAVDEILAITFTRKAAGEVAERVRRVLRYEAGCAEAALAVQHGWISTIHGFCSRILRRHPLEAAVSPGFRVLDPAEAGLMRERAFEEAAGRLWAEDGTPELVAAFGATDARQMVIRIHGRLRSLGATPEDLADVKSTSFGDAFAEALAVVESAIAAHPDQPANATQVSNTAALRVVLDALNAVAGLPQEQCMRAALETASTCTLAKRCPKTKGVVAQAQEALADLVGAVRDQEVARHAETLRVLLRAFDERYRELKDAVDALDQDDLQEAVERLFRRQPQIAESYARHFRMLMVDEFQDTNELQVGVIGPLRRNDLCVVGDERQAVYSFRDADVEVFRRVREGIARRVFLDTNFRSHPEVLAFVNALFGAEGLFGRDYAPLLPPTSTVEDARRGQEETPEPAGSAMPRAEVLLVEREGWEGRRWREAEAAALATRLAELVQSGSARPGEIVVLLRAFTNSAPYVAALEDAGLPAAVAGGGAFCDQTEIVEMEALLAVAALPDDEESLALLLLGDMADLSADTLLSLHWISNERDDGLWRALLSASHGEPALHDRQAERVRAVRDAVELLRGGSHRIGLGTALHGAVRILGVEESLLGRGASGERAWANVRKLIRMTEAFSAEETPDPAAFVEHLRALRRLGKLGQASAVAGDAVRLMTVHAAKGLEFPVVAVADLGHQLREPADAVFVAPRPDGAVDWSIRLPDSRFGESGYKPRSWQRMQEEERSRQHAEEKRLLYVACTRAEEMLILSGVAKLDEAEDKTPAGWVRDALGLTPSVGEPGLRVTGESTWTLRLVRPDGEQGEQGDAGAAAAAPARAIASGGAPALTRRPVDAAGAATIEPHLAPASLAVTTPVPMPAIAAGPPSALSFTALKTLEACAYRFYGERILRLRRSAPADTEALDFGNALHAALHAAAADGAGAQALSEDRLAAIALAHGLPHERLSRLAQAVAAFAASPIAARAYAGERIAREAPFIIPLGDTRLAGAMDLLSWEGDEALVVDYKTGVAPPRSGSLAEEYRLQAECYALALLESGATRVEVVFVAVERGAETSECAFATQDARGLRRRLEAMAARACHGPYERLTHHEPAVCDECVLRGGVCGPIVPRRDPRDAA